MSEAERPGLSGDAQGDRMTVRFSTLYRSQGSLPEIPGELLGFLLYGGLAQLGERLLCKQEVSGSSPLISTTWVASSAG